MADHQTQPSFLYRRETIDGESILTPLQPDEAAEVLERMRRVLECYPPEEEDLAALPAAIVFGDIRDVMRLLASRERADESYYALPLGDQEVPLTRMELYCLIYLAMHQDDFLTVSGMRDSDTAHQIDSEAAYEIQTTAYAHLAGHMQSLQAKLNAYGQYIDGRNSKFALHRLPNDIHELLDLIPVLLRENPGLNENATRRLANGAIRMLVRDQIFTVPQILDDVDRLGSFPQLRGIGADRAELLTKLIALHRQQHSA